MSFKEGDRVAVYFTDPDTCTAKRFEGSVSNVNVTGSVFVKAAGDRHAEIYHYKQCRRLVKKERRRVWVKFGLDGGIDDIASSKPAFVTNYVELIEVKKKHVTQNAEK